MIVNGALCDCMCIKADIFMVQFEEALVKEHRPSLQFWREFCFTTGVPVPLFVSFLSVICLYFLFLCLSPLHVALMSPRPSCRWV